MRATLLHNGLTLHYSLTVSSEKSLDGLATLVQIRNQLVQIMRRDSGGEIAGARFRFFEQCPKP